MGLVSFELVKLLNLELLSIELVMELLSFEFVLESVSLYLGMELVILAMFFRRAAYQRSLCFEMLLFLFLVSQTDSL